MITIITDASHDYNYGAAGWAAWAKADGWEQRTWAGPVTRLRCENSSDAEAAALLYGFIGATRHFPPGRVLLQSDCSRALCVLRRELGFGDSPHADGIPIDHVAELRGAPLTPCEALVVRAWRMRLAAQPTRVMVRHVKGHTKQDRTGRYWVNRHVDRLAKIEMRKVRYGMMYPEVGALGRIRDAETDVGPVRDNDHTHRGAFVAYAREHEMTDVREVAREDLPADCNWRD